MIRYISHSGATRHDIPKFAHVKRLGKLLKVIGYRYQSKRRMNETEHFTTTHEAVKVIGANGYCRFDALCWGYSGEGPRGLAELLMACGVSREDANKVAMTSPRKDPTVGVDWTLDLTGTTLVDPKKVFVDYCLSFYGTDGLYPMGATAAQVEQATADLIGSGADVAYDSFDREKVRDILIQKFGLVFPKPLDKSLLA